MAVKVIGKYAPVIAGSFLVGAAIFVLSFVVMDFVWTHFVGHRSTKTGDGEVVVGGGFVWTCVWLGRFGSCALSILAASKRKITNILQLC
jgi:hypothetical protein